MEAVGSLVKAVLSPPGKGNKYGRYLEHALFLYVVYRVLKFVRQKGLRGVMKTVLAVAIQTTRAMPGLKGVVEKELEKEVRAIEEKMLGDGDEDANLELPADGRAVESILAEAQRLHDIDNFAVGKKWAGIYHEITEDTDLEALQARMWALYNNSNGLYPGVFKSVRKFEAEIVQMLVTMLHGRDTGAVGLLTSGGTESILIAILSYREQARARGIEHPEVVCCRSAHGALDKACHYFGLKLVKTEADPKTLTLTPALVRPLLTPNTIAVYASAPSFPHGTVDPIEDLAALTRSRNIGLHVDNCLGGFFLSGLQRAGLFRREFDFRVKGVTTISIDVHKYGYAPKGVSAVLFADSKLRSLSIHPVTTGLTLYVTPTLQGSRGGGVIAAAWATLMYHGMAGYVEAATRFHGYKRRIEELVERIPELYCPVQADVSIVPIASDTLDIYAVASLLEKRGWSSFTSRDPPLMQICIGEVHARVLDDLLRDLEDSVQELRDNPGTHIEGGAAVYGAAKLLPDEVLSEVMKNYVEVTLKVKPKEKAS